MTADVPSRERPTAATLPAGWRVAPLEDRDCDELGRVHMAVWREAYAGIMPADYLAGLSDERCAERWHTRAAAAAEVSPARPGSGLASSTLVVHDPAGRVAGFASAGPSRDDDAPTPWELWAVNLAQHARGTGVADVLLDRLVGERDASLWVVEGNTRAIAFYARRGFVDDGARTAHEPTATTELRMVRRTRP